MFLPVKHDMAWVVTNMIIRLRHPLGCRGHLLSVGFWEEVVMFSAVLRLVKISGHIHPPSLPLNR